MSRERHIDFMISDSKYKRIKMRFYPRQSNMHGCDDEPPKDFSDVYKVYYSWAIMESMETSWTDEPKWSAYDRVFYFYCDECSALLDLSYTIRHIIRYKRKQTQYYSLGQPASIWNISYHKAYGMIPWDSEDDKAPREPERDWLTFEVWNNWTNQGYTFDLSVEKAKEFCDYLDRINQHMLKNGVPI